MAYTGTPVVRRQRLWVANAATEIRLDTPAWFCWLQTATSFSYLLAGDGSGAVGFGAAAAPGVVARLRRPVFWCGCGARC